MISELTSIKIMHSVVKFILSLFVWFYLYIVQRAFSFGPLQADPQTMARILNTYNYMFSVISLFVTFAFAFIGAYSMGNYKIVKALVPLNIVLFILFTISRATGLNEKLAETISKSMEKFDIGAYIGEFVANMVVSFINF